MSCGGINTASQASDFGTCLLRLMLFDASSRSTLRRNHWIESGQPTQPWPLPGGGRFIGSSFLAICQVARVKIKYGEKKLFTIRTVPMYVEDFYAILKVNLPGILLKVYFQIYFQNIIEFSDVLQRFSRTPQTNDLQRPTAWTTTNPLTGVGRGTRTHLSAPFPCQPRHLPTNPLSGIVIDYCSSVCRRGRPSSAMVYLPHHRSSIHQERQQQLFLLKRDILFVTQ